MITGIPLLLAFCSMVYELILAQFITLFFGGTIINFSICISLFLFSMGMGSFASEKISYENKIKYLLKIEIGLSLIGLMAVIFIYGLGVLSLNFDSIIIKQLLYAACFLPILIVGYLSGFEVPLLMSQQDNDRLKFTVLAMDYLGSFIAAIIYSLVLIPQLGLLQSLFITVSINTMVFSYLAWLPERRSYSNIFFGMFYLVFLGLAFFNSQSIEALARNWMLL